MLLDDRPPLPLNPFDGDPPLVHGLPMAGGRFPKLGHLPALAWDLPGLCDWAERRYGEHTWLDRGFDSRILQLSGDDSFAILRNKVTDSSALYDVAATFLGHSMIVIDGSDHRRVRGASAHAFSPAGLNRAGVGETVGELVRRRVSLWPHAEDLGIVAETRELALELIFRIMGIASEDVPEWRHQFEELALSAINIPFDFPGMPMWRGRRAARWIEARLRAIVLRARTNSDHDSLVGAMTHGKDEKNEGLSDDELIHNMKLLVLAGHETTASVLAWAFLLLAEHPTVWTNLVDEAASFDGLPTSAGDLNRVPLAEGIFREALRLYPPVPTAIRKTTAEVRYGGCAVPKGTILACNLHSLSRDPERYPDPDRFRPERWLELGRRPTPFEMCQFGGGPHFCLGYHVAMLEGVALLIGAAQTLSASGMTLAPRRKLPRPRYVPVLHPPRKAGVRVLRAGASA